MTTEETCPLSELPPAQCGCDRHRGKPEPPDRGAWSGPAVATTRAHYDSECPGCGAGIEEGDLILLIDGEWVCDECSH